MTIHFPNEEQRSAEIQDTLSRQFGFARRLLSFWLGHDKDRHVARSGLSNDVVNVAVLLNAQSCVLFRSSFDLCERADGFSAAIMSRSLFETVLALAFVLRHRVRLFASRSWDKGRRRPKRDEAGHVKYHAQIAERIGEKNILSCEFRANLYIAGLYFSDANFARKNKNAPGLKRLARRTERGLSPEIVAEISRRIGPKWRYILEHRPFTYSGLNVAALAELIGKPFPMWYATIYHHQSRIVHGTDALRFLHVDPTHGAKGVEWFSSGDMVLGTLNSATGMFLAGLMLMHDRVGLGTAVATALDGFKREWHGMSRE
jgi:hypothetical protein